MPDSNRTCTVCGSPNPAPLEAATAPARCETCLAVLPPDPATAARTACLRATVRLAYLDILGREPEAEGWTYWSDCLAQGMTGEEMHRRISNSPEALARTAAHPDVREAVRQAYLDVLQREPDPEGWTYWSQRMTAGLDVAGLRRLMAASPEAQQRHQTGAGAAVRAAEEQRRWEEEERAFREQYRREHGRGWDAS